MKKKTLKNANIMKRSYAFKGYMSTYNVDIFNSFNPGIQLKDKNLPLEIN